MPTANLRFVLPEEEYDFLAAVSARESLRVIAEIDEFCRQRLKYRECSDKEAETLRAIRGMVPPEIDRIIHGG